jgi:hypothetical protein
VDEEVTLAPSSALTHIQARYTTRPARNDATVLTV